MSNVVGRAGMLTVLTPILPGQEEELHEYLLEMQQRDQSPFQRVGNTHFARWVIIDKLGDDGGSAPRDVLQSQYLLFTAVFDGTPNHYVESLGAQMIPEAHEIWGHCVGYPGTQDSAAFRTYLRHNQIDATLFFAAYPGASLPDVLQSLALREKLIEFAVMAQGLEAQPLYEAYRNTFDSGMSF